MLPTFLFPIWLASFWHSVPYNYQIPFAIIFYIGVVVVARTLDQWVKSLRKDPIALLCHGMLVIFLVVILGRVGYNIISAAFEPISQIIITLKTSAERLPSTPLPNSMSYILNLTIVSIACLITWWLGRQTTLRRQT